MTQQKEKLNWVAIITMCFIFAMISFVTNMGAPFGNIWGQAYPFAKAWGNFMNFFAYLFMGIPAGLLLKKVGYKKTALYALILGVVGLAIQYLSSIYGADTIVNTYSYEDKLSGEVAQIAVALNLYIYLLGAFVCGLCVCMLNTVVNPMLNILGGGGNRGNQFIQIGGTLNSLTGTLTPLLAGILVGEVTANTQMGDVAPLLFIGMAVFALSFLIISRVNIPEPNLGAESEPLMDSLKGALGYRHLVLGVIAIFFYVGVEIGIPMEVNFYLSTPIDKGGAFGFPTAIGGSLAAAYWFMMLIGRACSTVISGKVSTKVQMTVVSAVAIVLLLAAIFLPESATISFKGYEVPVKVFLISACGLCTSIMWGGIFNLSVEGLGKYTEAASGIFMVMVVGGGVMPIIQEIIAESAGPIQSYWLVIAMIAYILFYSLVGCKNVNKK